MTWWLWLIAGAYALAAVLAARAFYPVLERESGGSALFLAPIAGFLWPLWLFVGFIAGERP